jgi:hypothetical protein
MNHPARVSEAWHNRRPETRSHRTKQLSRLFTVLLLSLSLWLIAIPARCAGDSPYSEDAVKAAYLHRFAAYVEWPAPRRPDTPFTIGVLGSDAVLAQLERLLPAINIQGRPASAHSVKSVADLEDVAILYVGPGRVAGARRILSAAVSRAVLVVTDEPEGLVSGGVINFVRMGSNVRFEVSQPAADRNRLKIDAALLAVAARVEPR